MKPKHILFVGLTGIENTRKIIRELRLAGINFSFTKFTFANMKVLGVVTESNDLVKVMIARILCSVSYKK